MTPALVSRAIGWARTCHAPCQNTQYPPLTKSPTHTKPDTQQGLTTTKNPAARCVLHPQRPPGQSAINKPDQHPARTPSKSPTHTKPHPRHEQTTSPIKPKTDLPHKQPTTNNPAARCVHVRSRHEQHPRLWHLTHDNTTTLQTPWPELPSGRGGRAQGQVGRGARGGRRGRGRRRWCWGVGWRGRIGLQIPPRDLVCR